MLKLIFGKKDLLEWKPSQPTTKMSLNELLAELPKIDLEKQPISRKLQEISIEPQLLSLAEVSIEQETERLKKIFIRLGKL